MRFAHREPQRSTESHRGLVNNRLKEGISLWLSVLLCVTLWAA
jgi:hypothetical protein